MRCSNNDDDNDNSNSNNNSGSNSDHKNHNYNHHHKHNMDICILTTQSDQTTIPQAVSGSLGSTRESELIESGGREILASSRCDLSPRSTSVPPPGHGKVVKKAKGKSSEAENRRTCRGSYRGGLRPGRNSSIGAGGLVSIFMTNCTRQLVDVRSRRVAEVDALTTRAANRLVQNMQISSSSI